MAHPAHSLPLQRGCALLMKMAITVTMGSDMIPFLRPWLAYGSTLLAGHVGRRRQPPPSATIRPS